MGELVLLENELINIYEGSDKEQIVSGRELHEFLEVGTKYKDWFPRMLKYGFEENVDYVTVAQKRATAQGNETTYFEHYLKMDMAKEIAMIQRNEKGKMARQYFITVEKKYRELTQQTPMTMEDLIIHNAQLLKETRMKQEEQDRKLKELELKSTQQENKVLQLVDYTSKVPDFKAVQNAVNKYARLSNISQGEVWGEIYKTIGDMFGINFKQRIKNAHDKIQKERAEKGNQPYKQSTLNTKYNGMNVIKDEKLEKNVIELLISMTNELNNK